MKIFYAERYRCFGDAIPFWEETNENARLYRKAIRWKKSDILTLIKLILCYLLLVKSL